MTCSKIAITELVFIYFSAEFLVFVLTCVLFMSAGKFYGKGKTIFYE